MDGLTSKSPVSSSASAYSVDPPRPAREGYERSPDLKIWKRRRRSRKSQSQSGSGGQDSESHTTSSPKTPQMLPAASFPPQSPYMSESAHVYSLQHPMSSDSISGQGEQEGEWLTPKHRAFHPSLPSMTSVPTLEVARPSGPPSARSNAHNQFASRNWNRLSNTFRGSRSSREKTRSDSSEHSVGVTEDAKHDAVKNYLDRLPEAEIPEAERPEPPPKSTSEGNVKSRRVRFGRVLWHRRTSSSRASSETVKNNFTSKDQKARPTSPQIWLSQFPGGEATRVHTPPYKEDTADGRPRSMFFDVASVGNNTHGIHNGQSSQGHSQPGTDSTDSSSRGTKSITTASLKPTRPPSRSQEMRSPCSSPGNKMLGSYSPCRGLCRGYCRGPCRDPASGRNSPCGSVNRNSSMSPANRRKTSPLPLRTKGTTSSKSGTASSKSGSNSSKSGGTREWWDSPARRGPGGVGSPPPGSSRNRKANPPGTAALFEFDVPEHLPSSPMCPANLKNMKTLGKGVCVYHGRRKSSRYQVTGSDPLQSSDDGAFAGGGRSGDKGQFDDGNSSM
ncbi:hypothetical protein QBC35DRAFT_446026 [Podospora australis]|uniref:Uncharacterized protein n=1 Tax=Podospora australis TaxID=1536484 RepID=A0AAN7AM09_9PEZI|nr:hypothetical protein QBC35DRAFT_446026 [Podospora australis]